MKLSCRQYSKSSACRNTWGKSFHYPGAKGRYSLVAQYVQCQATNDCRYMGKQYRQLNVIIQVEFYNNSCFDQDIEINESAPTTDCCVENTWKIIVQIIEAFHVLNVEPCFQNISKCHSIALYGDSIIQFFRFWLFTKYLNFTKITNAYITDTVDTWYTSNDCQIGCRCIFRVHISKLGNTNVATVRWIQICYSLSANGNDN